MIDQDEAIYKQYSLTSRHWVAPDGTIAASPKDEGYGLMISSFVSRDFGFGQMLTQAQLQTVNDYRQGESYLDLEAAMEINKKKEKPTLTTSPFICKFEYGQKYSGYWNYNIMVLQLEDVCDTPFALYGDQFEYVFFFDHSSGHDKLRPDGLSENEMNKGYGGNEAKMRERKIENETMW